MGAHSINDEAAAWAVRLDGAPLSAVEQRKLDDWLAGSAVRRGALLRARAVWEHAGAKAPAPGTLPASANNEHRADDRTAGAPGRSGYVQSWTGLRAASALLAAVALVLLGYAALGPRGDRYATEVGEVRRIALADGSAITLNSDSVARVRLQKDVRTVQLEHGEAVFEVAKDKSRPFVVSSGVVSVRAVGTAFAVRALADHVVTVIVTEGIVEVTRSAEPAHRVRVNQRAEFRPYRALEVQPEDPAEASRRLSWREGMVSFSGESLAEAAREVNRYSRRQVEVSDPALATRPVVGIFRTGDVDAFAQATAAALGAQYQVEGQVIRLHYPVSH